MLQALPRFELTDLIDMAAVGLLLWAMITWARREHG